ncbi:MAG: spermidine synthase [Verrucomicrobiales bacterium]
MRRLTTVHTGLQKIDVWGDGAPSEARQVEFRVAGAAHAWWHRDRYLTGLAWDNICAACLLRPAGPPHSVLMLGLAGGTSLRALRHLVPNIRVTAVDYDPGIIQLARRYMDLDSLRATIHPGDAYAFVRTYRGPPFDVVVDDVYQALDHDVARPGAWSDDLSQCLRRLVAPGGLLVVNLVTGFGHRALQSDFRRMLRRQWPEVRSVTTPRGMNEALTAGERVLGGRALGRWRNHWALEQDRAHWDRLRVRRL